MTTLLLGVNNFLETQRSNIANESIKIQANKEQARHNLATEQLAQDELKWKQTSFSLSLAQQQLEFAAQQSLRERIAAETERNNRAVSAINALHAQAAQTSAYSSVLNAQENARSNRVKEAYQLANMDQNYDLATQELFVKRMGIMYNAGSAKADREQRRDTALMQSYTSLFSSLAHVGTSILGPVLGNYFKD